eukprot:scaffold72069_cov20-Tisochrysis_lutea.AAC.2
MLSMPSTASTKALLKGESTLPPAGGWASGGAARPRRDAGGAKCLRPRSKDAFFAFAGGGKSGSSALGCPAAREMACESCQSVMERPSSSDRCLRTRGHESWMLGEAPERRSWSETRSESERESWKGSGEGACCRSGRGEL